MVAHLLRLKLTLLRNSLRRSPWQLLGLIIGGLYALGIVGFLGGGAGVLLQRRPGARPDGGGAGRFRGGPGLGQWSP